MIAEPTVTSRSSVQNENLAVDTNPPGAVRHTVGGARNENREKSVRGKRRAREGSENAKRRHTKTTNGGLGRAQNSYPKRGDVEAVTLFEVVTMGRSAMQAVVDDWIEAYIADRDSALLDLVSFFIQCSGCKGLVTAEMFQSRKGDVMSKMVEELDECSGLQYKKFLAFPWILTVTWPMDMDSGEYPLTMTGPYWRRFRSEFCEFVSVLVTQCQYSVIFDSYLMDTVISLLTELSDSGVRAFRHTCTLAAMKLLSSLIGVAVSLTVSIENSQRLGEVERAKTSGRRNSTRLERIQRKVTELQDKRVEIENMMDAIFKGVFLKRYRDVLPDIRSVCMEELAIWMKLYSPVFLTDSYLKYMGWMMHDKLPDVRLKCVLGLQGLYGDPVLLPKLDLFNSRFKDRLISMTLDKDHEVAVQTLRLLTLISQSTDDVLTAEDYKQLFQLVYSSHRPLAVTAGELLYTRLICCPAETTDLGEGTSEHHIHTQLTADRVRALLHFYQDSGLHQHMVYLVDSLWDSASAMLKDWPSLTSLLLQDASTQGLCAGEQSLVIEVLVASVRQAVEGPLLAGRSTCKRIVIAREKKTQLDDCGRLTEHFLKFLPQLLTEYSGSPESAASLLKIPQYFHPDSSSAGSQQALAGLLSEMGAVVDLHTDPAVLEAAARSYLSLCGEETAWHSLARPARDTVVQCWVDRLAKLMGDALQDGNFTADEDRTGQMLSTLKKLTAFHNAQDLSGWGLYEQVSPLLSGNIQHGGLPAEVTVEALQCVSFSVLWNLNTSGENLTTREKAVAQRSKLRTLCEKCLHCLSHDNQRVKEQAFLSLCDVLTAHNYQVHVWEPSSYGPLLYTPDPKLTKALLAFILEHVFTGPECSSHSRGSNVESSEGRLEELHRRRNLLAAYCKLIVHGVLEMSMAAEVFMYYMKYYNDFGDIIKETLSRTRQMDKIESARTLVLCLQQLFLRLKQEQDSGVACSLGVQTFSSIKELARRFSLTFGWDQTKSRESLALIHRDGIEFVFQGLVQKAERPSSPHLSYLTILSEFSSKLLRPDKKTVHSYLQRYVNEQTISNREECWLPLIQYRASLLATGTEGEDAASFVSSDSPKQPSLGDHSRSPTVRNSPTYDGDMKAPAVICSETKGRRSNRASSTSTSTSTSKEEKMPGVEPGTVFRETLPTKLISEEQYNTNEELDVDTVEVDL
ncbi:cohesin subunit SA-2 isoform X2 [Esox lucius]|uniref:cohesin subunit SA-2 isoform X2 n=1 Tax=Esox lucius TaxID=8010 RepID=UPI001476C02C|nr:cohesin subunit SA-2 isoform X2 [Esox lucius]